MGEAKEYSWDITPPMGLQTYYTSFSIGIFQWIPRASGRGLKRSGALTRVLGYVADPEPALAKARELCERLNRESSSSAGRPPWLQKQYSVSRPAQVPKKVRDGITAAKIRPIRLKLGKEILLPAGFTEGTHGRYFRRVGEQIHLVHYHVAAGDYSVAVALHYAFVPFDNRRVVRMRDMWPSSCVWDGFVVLPTDEKDVSRGYRRSDLKSIEEDSRRRFRTALSQIDLMAAKFSDPAWMLEKRGTRIGGMVWRLRDDLAEGWINLRLGRINAAWENLADWDDDRFKRPPLAYYELQKRLRAARQLVAEGVELPPLPNWFE